MLLPGSCPFLLSGAGGCVGGLDADPESGVGCSERIWISSSFILKDALQNVVLLLKIDEEEGSSCEREENEVKKNEIRSIHR
jgi:hypothetical protein